MSKAIMISIKPKWCQLIASGRKTMELRKSKPNLQPPFKCYIYCTKSDLTIPICIQNSHDYTCGKTYRYLVGGEVIGEFVCDGFLSHCEMANADIAEAQSLVRREKILEYAGENEVFGWHISNLVIYDKSKELSEFSAPGKCLYNTLDGCTYKYHCFRAGKADRCGKFLERPPQSWRYVEELEEKDGDIYE